MKSANHNIQKVFLEVNTQTTKKAYSLKDTIDDFIKEHLFPFIDNYFESLNIDPGINFQLEDLQLSLSVKKELSMESIRIDLKKQLDKVFLSEKKNAFENQNLNAFQKLNDSEKKQNTLLYFLEHGTYPWYIENSKDPNNSLEALFYESIESNGFIDTFKQKINNSIFRYRTVLQTSDVFLSLLIQKISSKKNKVFLSSLLKSKQFLNAISKVSNKEKFIIWNMLFDFSLERKSYVKKNAEVLFKLSKSNTSDKNLIQLIDQLINSKIINKRSLYKSDDKELKNTNLKTDSISEVIKKDTKPHIKNSISETKNELKPTINEGEDSITIDKTTSEKTKKENKTLDYKKEQKEAIQNIETEDLLTNIDEFKNISSETEINQEGVFYVENAGLILLHPFLKSFFEKCNLLDSNSINDTTTAIHLLHYLATGKVKQSEHLQLMEKFLCNIPLQHPINRSVIINEELKENAQELLKAVLKHLPQLKSTSFKLFQNEFLQRPGKLIFEQNTTKLIIEQKTQDLLMKNIPWNISVIKLPWHKRMFFVDW